MIRMQDESKLLEAHAAKSGDFVTGSTDISASPSPALKESLSALMDNEASELEIRQLVRAMPTTPELVGSWRRYHAVRASLQQDVHQRPAVNLLAGVRTSLLSEEIKGVPSGSIARRVTGGRFMQRVGQLAIAASVAAAVLVGYPVLQSGDRTSIGGAQQMAAAPGESASSQAQPVLNGDFNVSPLTRTVSLDAAARNRLEKAVRNFSGTAAVADAGATPMLRTPLQPFSASEVSAPLESTLQPAAVDLPLE